MRKLACIVGICAMGAFMASAATVNYGWEDGGTVLGVYPAGEMIATNVGAPDPVHTGDRSLKLEDNSPSSTPQAYVAWIKNLQDGDVVTGSIFRYDVTPGVAPSARIWGHWNDNPDDVMGYSGSASGNYDYGPGEGWDCTSYDWTVADGHTGLVIEVRTYSNPGDWILDPCEGSGATGKAAAAEERNYIGIELDVTMSQHARRGTSRAARA